MDDAEVKGPTMSMARELVEVYSAAVLEEVDVVTDAMAQCTGNGGAAGEVCRCGDRGELARPAVVRR